MSTSKKGKIEGMCLDHLNYKLDALFLKFEKMSVNIFTPNTQSCEIYRVVIHTGTRCQMILVGGVNQKILTMLTIKEEIPTPTSIILDGETTLILATKITLSGL